jgi:hypothetical protein
MIWVDGTGIAHLMYPDHENRVGAATGKDAKMAQGWLGMIKTKGCVAAPATAHALGKHFVVSG